MPFHRLTTPAYFGGLPGGFDYLNTPSDPSVGGSGVPAPADGIKSGGPNDGTYFVGFGEDAQATAANRGHQALAENTDLLDDIVRTSIPTVTFSDATAVGSVATHALVGQVYVGESGAANNQAQRDRVVRITDQNNNDLEVSGTKIIVTLVHDGAAANVIGTQASGFRTNASVNVSPSIPNGTAYRVWFGTRNTFANISQTDKGALFEEQLRVINNVPGEVRALLRLVHSEVSVNQAWDAPFDSTIRSLASAGLNERYRRATTQPVGFVTGDYNVAGSGAVINRDGRAVEIQADVNMLIQNVGWRDGNHSLLKLGLETARSDTSGAITGNLGGDFGVWHESEWKPDVNDNDPAMFTRGESAGPALVDVVPYDMRVSTFDGDTLFTFIDASDDSATTNPEDSPTSFSVDCAPGNYFCLTGPTRTAIRLGLDMVEITDSNGLVRTFYIASIVSATRITVIGPAGTTSSPFQLGIDTGATLRIIQTVVSVGGYLGLPSSIFRRALTVIPPAVLTTVVANEDIPGCSFFGAQTGSVADATAEARRARALEWGGTASPDAGGTVNGTITPLGWLNGDGSIAARRFLLTGGGASIDEFGNAEFDDVVMESLTADDGTFENDVQARAFREMEPHRYTTFDEDFLFVDLPNGTGSDGIFHSAQNNWWYEQVSGTMSSVTEYPTGVGSKNPGVLRVRAAGGVTATSALRSGFNHIDITRLDILDIVAAVDRGAGNAHEAMELGFSFDGLVGLTSDQALAVQYTFTNGWRLIHRRNGSDGAHHLAALGSFTTGSYAHFTFVRLSSGDVEVYRDKSLVLTVTSAQMPVGLLNAYLRWEHSGSDGDATGWLVDMFKFRVRVTTPSRAGVP